MKKNLIRSGAALAVGVFVVRQALSMSKDVSRYNAMRKMSGDGPLTAGDVREALLPTHTSTKPTNAPHYGEDAKAPGLIQFLTSVPQDIARYLKISTM
jgi:hypothetical protein